MRILLTEAASQLAYHVASLLASEYIFDGQSVDLVLCDHAEKQDVVTGVMYELQDCLYPNLKGVSASSDFLQSVRSADVVLVLPCTTAQVRGEGQVQIGHALLTQTNFQGLDGAFHQRAIDMKDEVSLGTNGTLSAAVKVVSCLRNIYATDNKQKSEVCPYTTLAQYYREEAEFGVPPPTDTGAWSCNSIDNQLLMLTVAWQPCCDKTDGQSDRDISVLAQCISRL